MIYLSIAIANKWKVDTVHSAHKHKCTARQGKNSRGLRVNTENTVKGIPSAPAKKSATARLKHFLNKVFTTNK